MTNPLPGNLAANLESMPLSNLDDLLRRLATQLERVNGNPPAGREKEVATANAVLAALVAVSARRHADLPSEKVPTTGVVLDSVTTIVNQAAK